MPKRGVRAEEKLTTDHRGGGGPLNDVGLPTLEATGTLHRGGRLEIIPWSDFV